jgi:hypothetical protein
MSMKKGIQAMAFMTLGSAAVVYKVTNVTTTIATNITTTTTTILANTDTIPNIITITITITATTRSTSLKLTSVWRCGKLCT